MIISASRRTDIPAFYSDWFLNRIEEGFVVVPNPYDPKALSRIPLNQELTDCMVFWTKNPAPFIDKLDRLEGYKYYFQFTLNPYGKDIECNIPALPARINTFKRLSEKIGKEKVIWRYDPVLTNEKYDIGFHKEKFAHIADELKGHTEKCMLGFLDLYRHIHSTASKLGIKPLTKEEIEDMAASFKKTTDKYPVKLETCTSKVDLRHLGIKPGMCVDKELVERITGFTINAQKDKNQRSVCNCIESIDIGTYDSCLHDCKYCYAIKSKADKLRLNVEAHDKKSPMLLGWPPEGVPIRDRPVKSLRDGQMNLF